MPSPPSLSTRHLGALLIAATAACSPAPAQSAAPAAPVAPPPAATAPALAAAAPSPDAAFAALAQKFLDGYLQHSPADATQLGEHRYDDRWPDLSVAGTAERHAWLEHTRAELARLPHDQLSEDNQLDAGILDDELRFELFTIDELKDAEADPLTYTGLIGAGLDPLVTRDFGTKDQRMAALAGRLDGIPAIVAVAKQRLVHPAKVATETAIQQNKGLIALVETELPQQFAQAGNRDQLAAAAKHAAAALRDFQGFLETDLITRSDGSFRLGRERFAKKLAFALGDDIDIEKVVADARALLVQTQAEMVDTAKEIWQHDKMGPMPKLASDNERKVFVKQVLDHVAEDRPTNKTILADAKRWLDKATSFVKTHDLVGVPDEPVAVIEMPEYRRGIAVAYCDPSGPLEATQQTFFAISPTPSDWPRPRVESFYREYNQAMLAELAIHEAMPGHYLQLMHNNDKRASKLRAVFASGPFVEGWAVYGEWLMAKNGFGGPRVKLEREKMVLRLTANAILDHDIHAGTMDEAAALALMKGEAFQEDGEAVGKWRRARLSSAQLTTYFYGFSELLKLRRVVESQPGFTERGYHDKLLSFGSPSMKYIRRLIIKN